MTRAHAFLTAVAFAIFTAASAGAATFDGFLFSKLGSIGTRSEGPAYFLQTFDGHDIAIRKHAMLWQSDPALHRYLGTKVTIEGDVVGGLIDYRSIKPFKPGFDSLKN